MPNEEKGHVTMALGVMRTYWCTTKAKNNQQNIYNTYICTKYIVSQYMCIYTLIK